VLIKSTNMGKLNKKLLVSLVAIAIIAVLVFQVISPAIAYETPAREKQIH
jgi:uncharacterized surface anchored protein